MAKQPTVSFIVAMTDDRVIGRGNDLPWHIPDDLAHFKRITLGKPIIMGRRTYDSIGRPLPKRHNIVVTRDPQFHADGCTIVHTPESALFAAGDVDEVMVIGGSGMFEAFLPLADQLYLTIVHAEIEGDTFFPRLNEEEWLEMDRNEHGPGPGSPHPLSFITYKRAKTS
ncbi:hypothetical protein CAI21_02145 [Alkalilimnicola ehrlichii]|uniref:Dihydrofolate reductase n=1 Tax=Alkalilimnicola ehrlichii TaxID=351052 RepID=A0A3E0X390_9GAMM|nr:dihydrofolate reductase [Alkalilimnicola ehrlichii]RFA31436.1 hypothetical protein CAI21_02145 [Alkalilimnicola ehrlichii]RFA39292.1 hypothetical protein CAL65_00245 [Alkalilimnicola ehrlichii]